MEESVFFFDDKRMALLLDRRPTINFPRPTKVPPHSLQCILIALDIYMIEEDIIMSVLTVCGVVFLFSPSVLIMYPHVYVCVFFHISI